jgi:hypothetical protein
MTPDAQNALLEKVTTLLQDLRQDGTQNGEAMFLLGSAAANLSDLSNAPTWQAYKDGLTPDDVIQLLRQIDEEGNRLLDQDKVNFAYALQVVGMSLAASGADDPRLSQGAELLDQIIETTLTNFRAYAQTGNKPVN